VYGCHDMQMPTQYDQELYNQVLEDASWYSNYTNFFPDRVNSSRYSIGPLLKVTMDAFNGYFSNDMNNSTPLFYLYSGHDTGPMMPLLGALNQYIDVWVPYASLITLELFQSKQNQQYFVLASYNGNILQLPQPCDCNQNPYSLCSWQKFVQYITPMIPTESECPGINPHANNLSSFPKTWMKIDRTVPFFIAPTNQQLLKLFF
ncbi:hypothetical protein RFI_11157, partial [Reticulomyxa filosa]